MTNSFSSTEVEPISNPGSLALSMLEALGLRLPSGGQARTITFGTRRISGWPVDVKRLARDQRR